jgi:hypothetical protein
MHQEIYNIEFHVIYNIGFTRPPDFYLYFQVENIFFFILFMIKKNTFPNFPDFYLYFQVENIVFFILFMIEKNSFPNFPDFYLNFQLENIVFLYFLG